MADDYACRYYEPEGPLREAQPAAGQSNWLQRAFDVAKAHRIATSTRTLEAYGMVVLRADVVEDCRAAVAAGGLLAEAINAHVQQVSWTCLFRTPFPLGDFITKNAELLAQLPKEEKDGGQ